MVHSSAPTSPMRLSSFDRVYTGQLRAECNGVEYVVPPIGMRTGALLRIILDDSDSSDEASQAAAATALGHLQEMVRVEEHDGKEAPIKESVIISRAILGRCYWAMWDNDAPEPFRDRLEVTALTDFAHDRIRALQAWGVGGDPKALSLVMGAAKMMLAS